MISPLQEVDAIILNEIHDAVLLRQATGPPPRTESFQGFRFTDPGEWISHYRFHKARQAERCIPVRRVGVAEGNDFLGPLLFGSRAPAVLYEGAAPALGRSHLTAEFTLPEPGAPLPDLLQVAVAPAPGMELHRITFQAQAAGALHAAYGTPEGTPARVIVDEVGLFDIAGRGKGVADGFPVERIRLIPTGH